MPTMASRIEIRPKVKDAVSERSCDNFKSFFEKVEKVEVVRVLTIDKEFKKKELQDISVAASNPVTEKPSLTPTTIRSFDWALEVGFLPGVTDNIGHTATELVEDLMKCEFAENEAVYSSTLYLIKGDLTKAEVEELGWNVANNLIERIHIKDAEAYRNDKGMDVIVPQVRLEEAVSASVVDLDINDEALETIGKKGIPNEDGTFRGPLALSLNEMHVIRAYFKHEGRNPTDIELESIAQTWSEHCKHKIFASPIDELEEGLYRGYIKKATNEIRRRRGQDDFCVSVFKDNSGAIEFNEKYLVTDKAETHNSPSALDPYGGAITGIVGVNRDALGFGKGAKPIVNRYGFCFADPRDDKPLYRGQNRSNPMLPPQRISDGVIKGVEAGGNQSGIPGPQGFLYYNERYKGKPLVFVGTVGLIPREVGGQSSCEKAARPGDHIVMIGGRVGQDGIHGATFSSESLDAGSPSTAVQIGDPITQKRLMDAVLTEARDQDLYSSITDNGAGGISCSVAEMAKECGGCDVELEKVPLKYPNLEPWKIWVSESQERMTLAVPPEKWASFKAIMDKHGVEATVIGTFTASGRCVVKYDGQKIMDLEMEFLHEGAPLVPLNSDYPKPPLTEPAIASPVDMSRTLVDMIGRLNCASFAQVSTMFDHEVQGRTIVKPLQGVGKVNGPATVFKPDYEDWKGIVLSQGINPLYSDIDTYHMAAAAIDTAVRNAVSVGGNVDYMALMDNFCWCSSYDPYRLGQLKDCVRACYEYAIGYGTPYISGKDSMFNDFNGFDDTGLPIKISVPPTLLISSLGVIDDVRKCVTMDAKVPGDLVYVVGKTKNELGGSEYYYMHGELGANVPQVNADRARDLYRTFHLAIQKELIVSSVSIGIGGLGVALAKKAIAGSLGMEIDLRKVEREAVDQDDHLLFSETQSRFLVTVNPTWKDRFEALFGSYGASLIGTVTETPQLKMVGLKGQMIVDVSVDDLADSYFASNKFY